MISKRIAKWNSDRGLNNFDKKREGSFIYEELLELLGINKNYETKEEFRKMCREMMEVLESSGNDISPEDMADAFGDIIFFAYGALHKLHITHGTPEPYQVIDVICNANDTKGTVTNAEGKILKDDTFIEPSHKV